MNLDNLKHAWSQLKVMHQFSDSLSSTELFSIIDNEAQEVLRFSWERLARFTFLYSLLLFCFQG